jgi:hypothetical protein
MSQLPAWDDDEKMYDWLMENEHVRMTHTISYE